MQRAQAGAQCVASIAINHKKELSKVYTKILQSAEQIYAKRMNPSLTITLYTKYIINIYLQYVKLNREKI